MGQQNNIYPDLFTNYFYDPGLINPAYIAKEGKADVFIFYKQRTDAFSKIATYAVTGSKVFRKKNNSAHLGRVIFMNENEGPYIAKTRAYANYAYMIPISEKAYISAGASLGFVQVAFSAPSATAFGSYKSPDASLGMMFRKGNFESGISMMQAFNNVSEPLTASFRLRRYYNIYVSGSKELSLYWRLKGNLLCQAFPSVPYTINGNLLLSYHDFLSFGSGYSNKSGLNIFLSVNIPLGKDILVISATYNSPLFNSSQLSVNSMELNGSYNFR